MPSMAPGNWAVDSDFKPVRRGERGNLGVLFLGDPSNGFHNRVPSKKTPPYKDSHTDWQPEVKPLATSPVAQALKQPCRFLCVGLP